MAHSKPKAEITPAFLKRIADLEKKAREQSWHFRYGTFPRPWHTPESMENTNLLDVPKLHEPAWNRDEANRVYAQKVLAVSKGDVGTRGDLACMKKQIDFMAVEERAWRLRHASLARCATLAHGRLNGHGAENQGVFSMVKNVVENHRLAGANDAGQSGNSGDVA